MNRQRRMAMSRRLLNRPAFKGGALEPPPPLGETTRPLTDAEATEALQHAVARATRRICGRCGRPYDLTTQASVCPHRSLRDDPGR